MKKQKKTEEPTTASGLAALENKAKLPVATLKEELPFLIITGLLIVFGVVLIFK